MERTLPRPLDPARVRPRAAALAMLVVVGSILLTIVWWTRIGHRAPDWAVFAQVPNRLASGELFAPPDYNWRWSPVAAWLMVPIVAGGYWLFVLSHVAVLPLLGRWLALMTLLSWPFWADALASNTMTFSVVAGVLALRGNRWAAIAYLALFVLIPRPILAPLSAWILWKDRRLWRPVAALIAGHAGLVLLSGYADAYIATLLEATNDVGNAWNLAPTRLIGYWWLIVGLPVGLWFGLRGWLGVASLAVAPYLLPQYLLVVLFDVDRLLRRRAPI